MAIAKSAITKFANMNKTSRTIESNQEGIHPDLEELALKLSQSEWKGPLHQPTLRAFEQFKEKLSSLGDPEWILDSGCGVGASSIKLSELYPNHLIVGVDRSEVRLSKTQSHDRVLFLRAELGDLWRLLLEHKIYPTHHFILYPNPYPKKMHLRKRFHGSISLKDILQLCPNLELRSNWSLYLEEFNTATQVTAKALLEQKLIQPDISKSFLGSKVTQLTSPQASEFDAWTHFEKKYHLSGQELYQLKFSNS